MRHFPHWLAVTGIAVTGLAVIGPALLMVSSAGTQEAKKYTLLSTSHPVPAEVSEPVRKLLADASVQMLDAEGKAVCEVWVRKAIPAEAVSEQIKSGVTYREVKQTEILGVIVFLTDWSDYRKQKVKAGVYTLRLAYQPADGKHNSDFSDYQECALVTSAKSDLKTELLEPKALHEASRASIGSTHPGIFLLWPNIKPGKEPELSAQPKDHWVLKVRSDLMVDGKATGTSFGIGLNLVGHTSADSR